MGPIKFLNMNHWKGFQFSSKLVDQRCADKCVRSLSVSESMSGSESSLGHLCYIDYVVINGAKTDVVDKRNTIRTQFLGFSFLIENIFHQYMSPGDR